MLRDTRPLPDGLNAVIFLTDRRIRAGCNHLDYQVLSFINSGTEDSSLKKPETRDQRQENLIWALFSGFFAIFRSCVNAIRRKVF